MQDREGVKRNLPPSPFLPDIAAAITATKPANA
jgi:hypothetical protein